MQEIQVNNGPGAFPGLSYGGKNMYIPEYLNNIQRDLCEADCILTEAMQSIERSEEYMDRTHPFHAAAVSTYNKLLTIVLTITELEAPEQ
jgi:hypothetical protein